MSAHRPATLLAALALLGACRGAPAALPDAGTNTHRPEALAEPPAPPATLFDTGLYAGRDTTRLADDVLSFSPQYPLWTDGAEKRRFFALPPGTAIDARDPDSWRFPVGTRIWKEFAHFGRPIETRYLELAPEGWVYATYVWSEDGREARLADARGVELTLERGLRHSIPSHADCVACHGHAETPVLGLSTLQLSPDRDPLAPHAAPLGPDDVDLRELAARGLVRGLPPRLLAAPPRIDARTPTERAALGYLHGNCGGCHRDEGPVARLGMRLAHDLDAPAPPAIATTLGVPSRFALPSEPDAPALRVVPGDPEASVLLARMRSRDPFTQMPPLGTHVVDEEAVRLVSAWIAELDPAAPR